MQVSICAEEKPAQVPGTRHVEQWSLTVCLQIHVHTCLLYTYTTVDTIILASRYLGRYLADRKVGRYILIVAANQDGNEAFITRRHPIL